MFARVVMSVIGTGLLAACMMEPISISNANNPASPNAAETPAKHASQVLDPSVAAAEMGPSRPAGGGTRPSSGMNDMEGMDMPGMGGMEMPGMNMGGDASQPASQPATTQIAAYYTCAMHPEIHLDHPGTCPVCGMSLVKKEMGQGDKKGVSK